jgi:predicted Zn finger-like uncharacterized protein
MNLNLSEMEKEYLATGGSNCPRCKSKIIVSAEPTQIDGSAVWQRMQCSNCGAEWHDLYTLTGMELIDD